MRPAYASSLEPELSPQAQQLLGPWWPRRLTVWLQREIVWSAFNSTVWSLFRQFHISVKGHMVFWLVCRRLTDLQGQKGPSPSLVACDSFVGFQSTAKRGPLPCLPGRPGKLVPTSLPASTAGDREMRPRLLGTWPAAPGATFPSQWLPSTCWTSAARGPAHHCASHCEAIRAASAEAAQALRLPWASAC